MSRSHAAAVQPGDALPRTDAPHAPVDVPNAPAAPVPAPAAPEKVAIHLSPARLSLAEQVRNIYRVVPADSTPYEAIFDPAYWAHVGGQLRPGDILEVVAEDTSYFATLFVTAATHLAAHVVELSKYDLTEALQAEQPAEAFDVKFNQALNWTVIRKRDNARVAEGLKDKAAGFAWIAENAKRA